MSTLNVSKEQNILACFLLTHKKPDCVHISVESPICINTVISNANVIRHPHNSVAFRSASSISVSGIPPADIDSDAESDLDCFSESDITSHTHSDSLWTTAVTSPTIKSHLNTDFYLKLE